MKSEAKVARLMVSEEFIVKLEAQLQAKNLSARYSDGRPMDLEQFGAWQARMAENRLIAQTGFLECLERSGSIMMACKLADIPTSRYRLWRFGDPVFCRRLNELFQLRLDECLMSRVVRASGYLTGEADHTGTAKRESASDRQGSFLFGDSADDDDAEKTVEINITSR